MKWGHVSQRNSLNIVASVNVKQKITDILGKVKYNRD